MVAKPSSFTVSLSVIDLLKTPSFCLPIGSNPDSRPERERESLCQRVNAACSETANTH